MTASVSLAPLITIRSVPAGHDLSSADTVRLGSGELPHDPVVVRVPDSSLPAGAGAGRPVTVYGTWKQHSFTLTAILLALEPVKAGGSGSAAVVMAERSQVRRYGQALLQPGNVMVAGISSP